ncbi:hypothetical protein FLA_0099 [Filimonas lacunae]|nr:hypothetical protein FLA_0099 [Filimonas lacunae]
MNDRLLMKKTSIIIGMAFTAGEWREITGKAEIKVEVDMG